MKNRRITLSVALAILLCSPVSMARQAVRKQTATAAPGRVEPRRVLAGELHANTVTGQVKQGWTAKAFSYTLTKAEIVNGRLQLAGDFALGGALAQERDQVTATIGGVMSNAANPWPNARQERRSVAKKPDNTTAEQRQEHRNRNPETAGRPGQPARSTEDTPRRAAPSEKSESTQSLYAQSDTSTSCGVVFLNLTLPQRLRARIGAMAEPLQLGVVLKRFDNERGEAIVKQICQLLQTSKSPNQSVHLDQLNRLFVSSK
jgi:hypothetical protein